MRYARLTVRLDRVQLAWLDALAELHECSRACVLREALSVFAAREHSRIARTHRYRVIGEMIRAEQFDPIGDYLSGIR